MAWREYFHLFHDYFPNCFLLIDWSIAITNIVCCEKRMQILSHKRSFLLKYGTWIWKESHLALCTVTYFVVTTNNQPECQPNIIGVVSPESGVATINVSLGDVIQRLKLPVGTYNYELFYKGSNCSVNVYIKGKLSSNIQVLWLWRNKANNYWSSYLLISAVKTDSLTHRALKLKKKR